MIYAELSGGLGNQMFIYAFARALGLRQGQPVTLIDRRDAGPAHTALGLGQLCISPEVVFSADAGLAKRAMPAANACKALLLRTEVHAAGGMMGRSWAAFERRAAPVANAMGLAFSTDGFVPFRFGAGRKDILAWGYFQSSRYFADAAPLLRQELRTRPELLAEAQTAALAAEIAACPCAVCVHIRRGDYQRPENAALNVCTPAYYAAAAKAAAKALPGAVFYVFSDDIAWAKQHFCPGLPTVFVQGKRPAAADLALMQRCRHFVLSNSTFGWWAQYLAAPGGMVFAPERWYTNEKQTDLYGEGWVKLPIQRADA